MSFGVGRPISYGHPRPRYNSSALVSRAFALCVVRVAWWIVPFGLAHVALPAVRYSCPRRAPAVRVRPSHVPLCCSAHAHRSPVACLFGRAPLVLPSLHCCSARVGSRSDCRPSYHRSSCSLSPCLCRSFNTRCGWVHVHVTHRPILRVELTFVRALRLRCPPMLPDAFLRYIG